MKLDSHTPESVNLRRHYNKSCSLNDWQDDKLVSWMEKLHKQDQVDLIRRGIRKHRKDWEHAMALSVLNDLGMLDGCTTALGIASGHEHFVYRLAHYCKKVFATDLYGMTSFSDDEGNATVLRNPKMFAPFDYPEDKLSFKTEDALNLSFDNDSFDFCFSFSSIEHFGGEEAVRQSLEEMKRVVRSGGYVLLTSEFLIKNVKNIKTDFFTKEKIQSLFIDVPGLLLLQKFDCDMTLGLPLRAIRPSLFIKVYWKIASMIGIYPQYPYIFITDNNGQIWTSFFMIYKKV